MNGIITIEEILAESKEADSYLSANEEWPDSVHHQSWHDSWRNSH